VPVEGNPLNTTLPVGTVQAGWVIVSTNGAPGVSGCELITTLAEATDVHPAELATVKVCVPSVRSETIVLVPLPVMVVPPGIRVRVHVPVGKSFKITLPVDRLHVGCVIVPIAGGRGMAFTVNVNEATAAAHGDPKGLFVVTVIITVLP
jgi:hypothetical protein